jgi:hypothetical protein
MKQLSTLLEYEWISDDLLLKMTVINISAIYLQLWVGPILASEATDKSKPKTQDFYRQATDKCFHFLVSLNNETHTFICESAVQFHVENGKYSQVESPHLTSSKYFPAICFYLDHIRANFPLDYFPNGKKGTFLNLEDSLWLSKVVALGNHALYIDPNLNGKDEEQLVVLREEIELRGFLPLFPVYRDLGFVPTQMENSKTISKRWRKVIMFLYQWTLRQVSF